MSESDKDVAICTDSKGNPEPDIELPAHELVPLKEDWRDFVAREVTPFVPHAWADESHTDARDGEAGRVSYEINFSRYFYTSVPPRPLEEIDAKLKVLEAETAGLYEGDRCMNVLFTRPVSCCFDRKPVLYLMITRPATPRTEPRFRTAHPGGLLVSEASALLRRRAA